MSSVFLKVLQGELPGEVVYENPHCFALMALDQVQPGHVLVIPKREVDHWFDLPEGEYLELQKVSVRIAKKLKQITGARRILCTAIGFEVPHYHFHLIPANKMSDFDFSKAQRLSPQEMTSWAQKIREALEISLNSREDGSL